MESFTVKTRFLPGTSLFLPAGDVGCEIKFALPPTQTPMANRWNLGPVRSPTQNSRVGHVDFMLFVLISIELGNQRRLSLQWNLGLKLNDF